ncbi:MAG: hydroxyisourate hydrolase [Gemmatimonadales bacterium]
MPNTNRQTISTHVLDTARGEPAAGVRVTLSRVDGSQAVTKDTDADGRVADLGQVETGMYRLSFGVGEYYKKKGLSSPFLDRVTLDFAVDADRRYHIPLLMSPFSCTSYRGS